MKRGWFSTDGRPGDRTLADQVKGLDWLFANCAGQEVLDVGCAEGLLAMELAKRGATVDGVDVVADHIRVAKRLVGMHPTPFFQVADANNWVPPHDYDVVLLLAVLHKLRNPTEAALRFAARARRAVVLRLPPKHAPSIIDARSGSKPHHVGDALVKAGFVLAEFNYDGHFGEWVGVYLRKEPRDRD